MLGLLQGSVRQPVAFGKEIFHFLDVVPYLISRLGLPGIAQRALAQFDGSPESTHNRNSISVFSASRPSLRSDVLMIRDGGTGISPRLQFEIDSTNDISCDDTIDEAPHSIMNRIVSDARNGNFAWQAATLRHKQNIQDARDIPAAVGADPQLLWNNYTSVLQVEPRRFSRPYRCTRQVFEEKVYTWVHMDGFADPHHHGNSIVHSDSDMDADACASSARPKKAPKLSLPAASNLASLLPKLDVSGKLMAEWLIAAMIRYIYVAILDQPSEQKSRVTVFQILSVKPKQALVKTFEDSSSHRYALKASV